MKTSGRLIQPLTIIPTCILAVFLLARLIAYLALSRQALPHTIFLNVGGFRLHHFVYGNILLLTTSFLAIGLDLRSHRNLLALFYGIGLGLVLDEFPLWMGDVHQLNSLVVIIPYAPIAVLVGVLCPLLVLLVRWARHTIAPNEEGQ